MSRVPAVWRMGLAVIIITTLIIGGYVGAQRLVAQKVTPTEPTKVSAPSWVLVNPTCGVVPLKPCEVTK